MKKKYSKFIIFVVAFLSIALIVISIDNLNSKKEVEDKSDYYASFVSSVQSLDMRLAQTNEPDIVQIFDVYTSIIFVNDNLTQLKERTKNFDEMYFTIHDFMLFRIHFTSLVSNNIGRESVDPEAHLKLKQVKNQIKLYLNDLPKKYENSTEFSNQLKAAQEHFQPLVNMSF